MYSIHFLTKFYIAASYFLGNFTTCNTFLIKIYFYINFFLIALKKVFLEKNFIFFYKLFYPKIYQKNM